LFLVKIFNPKATTREPRIETQDPNPLPAEFALPVFAGGARWLHGRSLPGYGGGVADFPFCQKDLSMSDSVDIDYKSLRINGIYQQNAAGDLMVRAKLPAGVLSAAQAAVLSDLAGELAGGVLHLTCRGNVEIHGLRGKHLPQVFRRFHAVGLTTRGAAGGAVRGISCSIAGPGRFARIQFLARCLHEHFTGNPHFEGLPKKIKIAVENGYQGARHLCQDLALVYLGREGKRELCDVWAAGGLGRQPQEGFLLAGRVPFERLLPLIEGVVRVYQQHAPPGKRLKHLLNEIGERRFRALLAEQTAGTTPKPLASPLDDQLGEAIAPGTCGWIELPVLAGQLPAADLRRAADISAALGDGFLAVSREQNLLVSLGAGVEAAPLREALQQAGLLMPEPPLQCRVCPGSHACPKGLVPTRDLARRLDGVLGERGRSLNWAISGCPNGCSQPQLADYGIVGVRKETENQEARYDLLRRDGEGFGGVLQSGLTLDDLLEAVQAVG
jgi:sulfite reductase (ferredoxin)